MEDAVGGGDDEEGVLLRGEVSLVVRLMGRGWKEGGQGGGHTALYHLLK